MYKRTTKVESAEKILLHSENRYRILAEKLADGVLIAQDRRIKYVNDDLCFMLGCTSGQIIGVGLVAILGDDCKEHFRKVLRMLETDNFVEYWQGACLGRDGQQIWIEAHQSLIKWEGRPAILSAIRDITERHNREIATKEETEYLQDEYIKLKSSVENHCRFGNIIGKSPPMQEVYELIAKAASTNSAVTIYGESGTGKELVAKAIHNMSDRCNKAFVPVNCGAIPENLLESEFFGYTKGAFTGAQIDKSGLLDIADGGTLLLDEVGELSLGLQVKLLRAIEGGGYRSIGAIETKNSDFRIISATNRDLTDLVKKGFMRVDFFYRLHVISITLPPLRERKEDIPLLVDHFLRINNNDKEPFISPKIMKTFMSYDWPGNVRELQNVLHRYLAVERLDLMNITRPKILTQNNGPAKEFNLKDLNFHSAIKDFEKSIILKVLENSRWHKAKAASILGLPRRTFFRKLKHFGLT